MPEIGKNSGVLLRRVSAANLHDDKSAAECSADYEALRKEALAAETKGAAPPKFNPEEWGL